MNDILQRERQEFARESDIFTRLREIGKKLNIIVIESIVRISVVDIKTGRPKVEREWHSHSFVRNAWNKAAVFPYGQLRDSSFGDGYLCNRDTGGTLRYSTTNTWYAGIDTRNIEAASGYYCAADSTVCGCLAGTDGGQESLDDYDLRVRIDHGVGGGQMEYGAMVLTEGWNAGSSYYYSIWSRPLDNNSGGSITAREVGIAFNARSTYLLMARDVISGGQVVLDGDRLNVDYETRVSF